MGRPVKSNAEKELTGSIRTHKTPELQPGTPTKPSGLSMLAAIEWDRLLAELQEAGLQITVAHRAPLTLAATIAADISTDWAEIQAEGAYSMGKNGIVAHPAVKRMDALRRDYLKALALLGLRAAVSAENPTQEQTLEDLLNG